MQEIGFTINDLLYPQILAADKDYVLAYKPPFMHSAPVRSSVKETLLDWCSAKHVEIAQVSGRSFPSGRGKGEGGLLHRLDYETHGLILLARTEPGMKDLLTQQAEGNIIKEYSALAAPVAARLPGFPNAGIVLPACIDSVAGKPRIISAFRPYGPGRKAVRPVVLDDLPDNNRHIKPYLTEILNMKRLPSGVISFRLSIVKGFRHQIRCHLAWLGTPILNDRLYGGIEAADTLLALRAVSLSFNDPGTGERIKFSIQEIGSRE